MEIKWTKFKLHRRRKTALAQSCTQTQNIALRLLSFCLHVVKAEIYRRFIYSSLEVLRIEQYLSSPCLNVVVFGF